MNIIVGGQFGNRKSIKVLMNHSVIKKRYGFHPIFLASPIALITKHFGFPPPPFRSSKRSLNVEKFLLNKIFDQPFNNFLEFGSGYGRLALAIAHFSKKQGICVDMDKEDIEVLNKLALINNINCKGITADICTFSLKKENLDLIYSTEVLEHIENDRALLEKCYAALCPGGRFIFQTPFHYHQTNDETEHEFGHVRNGYSEEAFERINSGLFNFKYYRVEKRSDLCKFCSTQRNENHPLKLIGIGKKE